MAPGTNASAPAPKRKGLGFSRIDPKVRWFILCIIPSAVGYGYLLVVIAGFLPELGISAGSVGLILGSLGASLVLGAIPLGILADRVGRKPVLLAGLFLLTPILLVFGVTASVPVLLVAAILAGIAEGAFLSSWNAAIADQTTVENREGRVLLSFIVAQVALGLGFSLPVFFPAIRSATGLSSVDVHRYAMIAVAFASLLSPLAMLRLYAGNRPTPTPASEAASRKGLRPLLKFSALNALIGLGAGFIIPLVPTWLFLKYGVPDTYSGPLLGLANVTIGFAAVGSALLSRRLGPVRAIVLTQGLSTVFMVALAFSPTPLVAGGVYLVRAALMNMSSPISDAFLMGIIPPGQRGLASAVNTLFWRLPNSVSTVVGGSLLAAGNYELPFFLAAGFYVVSITGFYAVFRGVRPAA